MFLIAAALVFFWLSLPSPVFKDPCATVIEDRNGILLGARIAGDEQWRFPESVSAPYKYEKALIQFEDRYFYYHNGINPVSFIRALIHNLKAGRVVSGGSTISMQVIRLSRKGRSRTIFEKIVEACLALRLELGYSKREILRLYASHAPFGGNVVGIDAAAWRYFGKKPEMLSWAEAATLAVLPNSPSLIYPGKNHDRLLDKRNRLLTMLHRSGYITGDEFRLACSESLPGKPFPLPSLCPHLLDRAVKEGWKGKRLTTSIDAHLQALTNNIIKRYHDMHKGNKVNNAAVVVLNVESGNALVYAGNTYDPDHPEFQCDVDIIVSPRSTGSILKPFLYAAMLSDGQLLPSSLVADIPMQIGSFMPENYSYTYDGAVPAKRALSRSLNIPAVKMLQQYGVDRFSFMLKKTGLTTLHKPASHYGLSLILGGAEASLWDLAGAYASMARTLNHYGTYDSRYSKADFHPPSYVANDIKKTSGTDKSSVFRASAIWFTFEAMNEVSRPDEDASWQEFTSSSKIAWKTGTSYGSRDAWSIGCNPRYVVAVWVGNSGGEGRPGVTGLTYAAPLMFEVFKSLKQGAWFYPPYDDMMRMPVCRHSGYKAGSICQMVDTIWVPKQGVKTKICPYHQMIHLDASGQWRVTSDCENVVNMRHQPWFVLPPVMEYYFKAKNPFYQSLPPFRDDCQPVESPIKSLEMIYPKNNSKIYIPLDVDGNREKAVFKAAHHLQGVKIFWYLNGSYSGTTSGFHQLALSPPAGKHRLTLVDEKGEYLFIHFEVLDKKSAKK